MPQETANMIGRQFFLNIKVDQAVPLMTQPAIIEIFIEREKRRLVQLMQQWNYLVIVHPPSADFLSQ